MWQHSKHGTMNTLNKKSKGLTLPTMMLSANSPSLKVCN